MMNPFKTLGELKNARDQMVKIQRELENTVVAANRGNVEVEVTADMKVKSIIIAGEEKRDVKEAVNEALDRAKREAAAKMKSLSGGLGGLLGQ